MSKELAESAFQVANDNAITHFGAFSESLLGWLLAKQGTLREGLGMLQKGMDINYETGNLVELVNQFCMLAEVYYQIEEYQNALHSLDDALERIDQTGERYLLSEVYRIRGDVLLMMQKDGEAERAYMNAIETARQQEARMFELRASTSLARLWHKQGKRTEAKKLLQAIYDWFTEGFDTVDLKKARELLELLV